MAVPQLWSHRHRKESSRGMPRMRPRTELLRDQGGELLILRTVSSVRLLSQQSRCDDSRTFLCFIRYRSDKLISAYCWDVVRLNQTVLRSLPISDIVMCFLNP